MSVFTRVGKGVNGAIKPEFVDYGGNFAIHQIPRGSDRWQKSDRLIMEPTLNHTLECFTLSREELFTRYIFAL